MIIRKMVIDDYKKIYQLWMSCQGMGLNSVDDSKIGIERFLKRNPDTCFVAEEESAVKEDAIVKGVIMAGNDGRRGYIYHTAVLPSCRHQGIGAKLVHSVLYELKVAGISKVALVVFDRNLDGNLFWEKQGFTKREDLVYRNITLTEVMRIDT